jgi:hypothetical protein
VDAKGNIYADCTAKVDAQGAAKACEVYLWTARTDTIIPLRFVQDTNGGNYAACADAASAPGTCFPWATKPAFWPYGPDGHTAEFYSRLLAPGPAPGNWQDISDTAHYPVVFSYVGATAGCGDECDNGD